MKPTRLVALSALLAAVILPACDSVEDFGELAIRVNGDDLSCLSSGSTDYPHGTAMSLEHYEELVAQYAQTPGFSSTSTDLFEAGTVVVVLSDAPTPCDALPIGNPPSAPSRNLTFFIPPEPQTPGVYAGEALVSGPNPSGEPGGGGFSAPQVAEITNLSATSVEGTVCFDDNEEPELTEILGFNPSTSFTVEVCPD